jgi:hypothetical protein
MVIAISAACFNFYVGQSLVYNIYEPKFVAHNELLDNLSKKYKFTVFDFALAKKEAHLKALRAELISENYVSKNFS